MRNRDLCRSIHRRRLLRTISFVVSLIGLLLAAGAVRATEPQDPFADFDDYARAALTDFQVPGIAVAVVKDGKIVFARGYGTRHAGQESPVDEQTLFPIASVTKVFTATCLALLVDEQKLKLNDPVVTHLPEFELCDPFLTRDVRIDDLLSHRVGLETADLVAYRDDYNRAEIIRRLRYLQPVAPFRSRFGYHNHMVTTAGELLERVSGKSWASFLRARLLQPIGMGTTLADPRELEGREERQRCLGERQRCLEPKTLRLSSDGFTFTNVRTADAREQLIV